MHKPFKPYQEAMPRTKPPTIMIFVIVELIFARFCNLGFGKKETISETTIKNLKPTTSLFSNLLRPN